MKGMCDLPCLNSVCVCVQPLMYDLNLKGAFELECGPWKREAGATLSVGSLAFSVCVFDKE